jgi:hypothetical protein
MCSPLPEALAACADETVADVCSMILPGQKTEVSRQRIATLDNKITCLPEGAPTVN